MAERVRVVVFGTGIEERIVDRCFLQEKVEIVVYLDNNVQKHNKIHCGRNVIFPVELSQYHYDCIVLSMHWYQGAYEQLMRIGIPEQNIIIFYEEEFMRKKSRYESIFCDNWQNIAMEENFKYRLKEIEITMESRVNNLEYEIADQIEKKGYRFPTIKPVEDALNKILAEGCSLARFGDGEFMIMLNKGAPDFQERDTALAKRLEQVLQSKRDKLLIAIPNFFGEISVYDKDTGNGIRKYLTEQNRELIYEKLDWKKEYYNAYLSRPYIIYEDKSDAQYRFNAIKEIWKNKDIVIVEGNKTRMGVGNDLFFSAHSVNRILVPNENAFACYEEILAMCCMVDLDKLFILAIGPTATVLAYDLENLGYQAIDIGHLDNEYEWFLKGKTQRTLIAGKYVNEVRGGALVEPVTVGEMEHVIGIIAT